GVLREVALRTRVATPVTGVNQVGQWLCARCALVKVGSLPAEGIRRHHRLRAKPILTNGARKVDLLKRRHGPSPTAVLRAAAGGKGKNCAMRCRGVRHSLPADFS